MPSSWRGARCILAYGEYRWPLYYSSKEAKGIWRMTTNTMANEEHRPHPPVQFLSQDLPVAERQQTWTLLTQIQPICPGCPWYQQNYLLHWILQFDYRLPRSPPTLSSRTPLLLGWPNSNRGQTAKFGTTLLSGTPSSIASSRSSLATFSPKGDLVPTSSSHWLVIYNERRGKWLITLHGGFTHLFIKV